MASRIDLQDLDIQAYPTTDHVFRDDVQVALARSRETLVSGRLLLEAVQRDLRSRYPSCVIHEQEPLAILGRRPARWYVYRDGKIA